MSNTRRQIIQAWERLPQGNYNPRIIEFWLSNDMKPAIDAIRAELAEEQHILEARESVHNYIMTLMKSKQSI